MGQGVLLHPSLWQCSALLEKQQKEKPNSDHLTRVAGEPAATTLPEQQIPCPLAAPRFAWPWKLSDFGLLDLEKTSGLVGGYSPTLQKKVADFLPGGEK